MPDPRPEREWHEAIETRLAALGVPPPRRLEIVAEVSQHLADAGRTTLTSRETERLLRELARVERRVNLDPPVLGKGRQTVMATLWQDLKYAARSLGLNPAYTAIVIATLTLGIGANAAIFSVADAVMLRPYSYPGIDRIVALNETTRRGQAMSVAWPTFQDWTAMNQSFEDLGIYRNALVTLTGMGQAEGFNGAIVSSGIFGAMGIGPSAGRAFGNDDDKPGAAHVALISERLWHSRFDADPAIVGRSVILNNEPHVIVGVMPPGMRFPSRLTDVWLPLGPVVPTFPQTRGAHPGLIAMGRLKPGVSFDRAVADMDTVARRIEALYPGSNKDVAVQLHPYYEQIVQNIRPTLYVLLGAVAFVLLIGCANLANLMLARAERRHREIALRAALGAERRRIVQQLLTESLVLSTIGGTLGVILAWWLVKAFVASGPTTIPRIDLVGVDGRVVAFAAVLSITTGVVFGLAPALRASRPDLVSSLKQMSRSGGLAAGRRFRSTLVVAEVALALVLLVGAGLMIRSFARLMAVEPGFDPAGVVTMRLRVPAAKYADRDRWLRFYDDLVQRIAAIPGVTAAGVNSAVPLEGGGSEAPVRVEGRPAPPPNAPRTMSLFQAGTPDYLRAMGIRVVRGRAFTAHDTRSAPPVVIVDESAVAQLFPAEDPLGKRIAFEDRGDGAGTGFIWREIVGVVRHVRHYGIASEPPFVQLYTPLEQLPLYFEQRRPVMALVARTSLSTDALTAAVRREMGAIDQDIPVAAIQTMQTYLSQNTEQPRLSVMLLGGLSGLALLLAVIGIYGVVSYSVAQRTQEIGVRMALGATGNHVLRMVVRQALALVAAGVVIGAGVSWALGSLLTGLLYQVSPHDPPTLAAISASLAVVGLIASVVPALRATRVDPLVALRAD